MTQEEEWLLRDKYHGEKTEGFFADCARLKAGEPLAYIIGEVPFMNARISLDSHPLIPRTETEYWVEKVIEKMRQSPLPELKVLDLCAGSGNIGVAVLLNVPETTVDFVEIDEKHHETIKKNVLQNGIDPMRTTILGGDLFEKVDQPYDFILSNPPYIDPALDRSEESVRTYEPHAALYGGMNGMELVKRIIEDAAPYLKREGSLYIEHEPEQAEGLLAFAGEHGWRGETLRDQYWVKRCTYLVRKA